MAKILEAPLFHWFYDRTILCVPSHTEFIFKKRTDTIHCTAHASAINPDIISYSAISISLIILVGTSNAALGTILLAVTDKYLFLSICRFIRFHYWKHYTSNLLQIILQLGSGGTLRCRGIAAQDYSILALAITEQYVCAFATPGDSCSQHNNYCIYKLFHIKKQGPA